MRNLILTIFCLFPLISFSQSDWNWWNEKHGWEPGMPSWRSFLHITPGYLGPNALPVPDVKKGVVQSVSISIFRKEIQPRIYLLNITARLPEIR